MLDIKFVRDNPDAVKENIKKKFQDAKLLLVDEVIEKDAKWLERLESERVKIQANLALPQAPRSLDDVDLMMPIHDAAGMPVGDREKQLIEDAMKSSTTPKH